MLLALVPGLLGHGLMNWSLTRIPVWLGSTLTLAIPVTSTILAWLFIDEDVRGGPEFAGMGIVDRGARPHRGAHHPASG